MNTPLISSELWRVLFYKGWYMYLSYGDMVCLAIAICIGWTIVFYMLLYALEKMGFLDRNDQE
jgi:hypothetical protein